jgi:homoserine O-acetyltransferase
VHVVPDFAFETGGSLPELRVGYATHGALNARRDNAVLVTHGTSANRHSFDPYIGPGKALDTDRYFVVCVDAIGGGTSSSPGDGLGSDFPRYTIRDMVRAQHDLITRGLGLPGLLACGGSSMGSFQALEWGIHHPDLVRGLLLLVPAARAPMNFKAVVDTMIEIVRLDPEWNGGRYTRNPTAGLRAAGLVFGTWFVSDRYLEKLVDPADVRRTMTRMADVYVGWDAVSWMWRYLASRDHDVSKPFDGDLARALGRITARSLVMPSATDRVLPPFCAEVLRKGLARCTWAEIPSLMGHMAQNPPDTNTVEHRFVSRQIEAFLSGLY